MLLTLEVPFADTRAADLALLLDGPDEPHLGVLRVPLPGGGALELRLLGHSHQAVVQVPGRPRFAETVACGRGGVPGLPGRTEAEGYTFSASVEHLAPADFAARVHDLLSAADERTITGRFPGAPDGLTMLRAELEPGAVRWRTWHAYPPQGELVLTESRLWPV